jgi:hypothetical protein
MPPRRLLKRLWIWMANHVGSPFHRIVFVLFFELDIFSMSD